MVFLRLYFCYLLDHIVQIILVPSYRHTSTMSANLAHLDATDIVQLLIEQTVILSDISGNKNASQTFL